MKNAFLVEIFQSQEELLGEILLVGEVEGKIRMVEKSSQVVRHVWEYHVTFTSLNISLSIVDDVLVSQGLQDLDLTNGGDGKL